MCLMNLNVVGNIGSNNMILNNILFYFDMATVQKNTFMYCVEPYCQDPCLLSQKHPIHIVIKKIPCKSK